MEKLAVQKHHHKSKLTNKKVFKATDRGFVYRLSHLTGVAGKTYPPPTLLWHGRTTSQSILWLVI